MKNNNTFKDIDFDNFEEIDINQLIWKIDHSISFSLFEIYEDEKQSNILIKIKK